jgi:hypothetical protein
MGLTGLGCSSRHRERDVKFSREYLDGRASGETPRDTD